MRSNRDLRIIISYHISKTQAETHEMKRFYLILRTNLKTTWKNKQNNPASSNSWLRVLPPYYRTSFTFKLFYELLKKVIYFFYLKKVC